jgi:hypothetical protein
MKIFIPLLTLFLLISACAPASGIPGTASATPNIMPRLDPSPTPSGSTLPLTCQVTDLQVYINKMDGYCFAYPMRFTSGDQPSDKPDIQGPAVDDSYEPIHATLTMEVEPAATDTPLREQAENYLKNFSVIDPASFNWSQITVGGEIRLDGGTCPGHALLPDCLCPAQWKHLPPALLAGGHPGSTSRSQRSNPDNSRLLCLYKMRNTPDH